MLTGAQIFGNSVHSFRFDSGSASIRLLDSSGNNILLFAGPKHDDRTLVINDCFGGKWGEELRLAAPPPGTPGHGVLSVKFVAGRLELWTAAFAATFDRFDAARAQRVRFLKTYRAENLSGSLESHVLSPEAMGFELNHALLHARIARVERALQLGAGDVSGGAGGAAINLAAE